MSAYQRAFLYIKRKTGKTILLLVTFVILITLALVGLTVRSASEKTIAQLRENIGGYFKIDSDPEVQGGQTYVEQSLVDQVMEIEGVGSCDVMDRYYLNVPDLSLTEGRFSLEGDSKAKMTSFLGNSDSSLHEYFRLNLLTLTQGRHIQPEDTRKALVSEKLAGDNGLAIGDIFSAVLTEDGAPGSDAVGTTVSLEIVGLFRETNEENVGQNTAECDIQSNFIFTDSGTTQEISQLVRSTEKKLYNRGAIFYVTDPRRMESIAAQVQDTLSDSLEGLAITQNNTAYQQKATPLNRLNGMTTLLVGLIVMIALVLLSLLLLLWERDRIHEAGVLMSFGISKGNILWQHFLECAALFLAAFLLSAAISFPVSGQIGQMLYANEVDRTEETENTMGYGMLQSDIPADVGPDEVAFSPELQPQVILGAGVVGLLLVGVSVSAAFLVIVRRKPKELLTIME